MIEVVIARLGPPNIQGAQFYPLTEVQQLQMGERVERGVARVCLLDRALGLGLYHPKQIRDEAASYDHVVASIKRLVFTERPNPLAIEGVEQILTAQLELDPTHAYKLEYQLTQRDVELHHLGIGYWPDRVFIWCCLGTAPQPT